MSKKVLTKSQAAKKAAAGIDMGLQNNGKTTGFKAVTSKAAKKYGSKKAGDKVAGSMFQNMRKKGML